MRSLLVANRGEIAVRIMHPAVELGIRTIAVYPEDDASALHTRRADATRPLRGIGPAAYAGSNFVTGRRAFSLLEFPRSGYLYQKSRFGILGGR